ncbi:MAG: transcription-repair coupling factor [Chloroflexi bacterium RBG_16_48_8]|nr:MAG: transcription-repair coupling factor [Chloroflexi bacterium RBG_16_48_8]
MNLSSLLRTIQDQPEYMQLRDLCSQASLQTLSVGMQRSVRPALAASLAQDHPYPVLYLVSRTDRMLTLLEEVQAWNPDLNILPFPVQGPLFYEVASWGPRTIRQRISALATLTADQQPGAPQREKPTTHSLILAPIRAVMTRTISPRQFISNSRWIKVGGTIQLEKLLGLLVDTGYQPTSLVTEPGQFSRRGGIIDLWPPSETYPLRIELFGDEIDSLREFDPSSQRSVHTRHHVRVTPAREGLPGLFQEEWRQRILQYENQEVLNILEFFLPWMNPTPSSLLDYLPHKSLILYEDRLNLENVIADFEEQALAYRVDQIQSKLIPSDMPLPFLTLAEINEAHEKYSSLDLGFLSMEGEEELQLSKRFSPGPRFGGQLRPIMEYIGNRMVQHDTVVVVSRQAKRLAELYSEEKAIHSVGETLRSELSPGDLVFIQGSLSEGWILQTPQLGNVHLLTDAELFGWARPRPRRRPILRAEAPETEYADLTKGDIVVHIDYGVGIFNGLVERTLDNQRREYLLVEYADGDQVYVPIHQADRITRYVGADATLPRLSRLGTQEWEKAKSKAQLAVEEVAQDLIDLYANRSAVKGYAFSADTGWQRELESSFPYVETEDQLHAIEEVKRSMEISRPMDILICGDVGYGKTEVALRAAFKAVMDGKQVAILVPTTVLAQQHFQTFKQRLAAFPIEVEMLSRFRSRSESTSILQKLENNQVDIVIGTHRLLQTDVQFQDLGLLIIDEEQRFGVTHKEYLKKKRTEVDVLTMTATPIPRTLYMALTGARDILTINTPPEERLPVVTHVGPYDPRLIRQAVLRELDRGGQVFFVHNRVMTIETIHQRLERLVPEARVIVAHGQMPEDKLASAMEAFSKGEVDVLLSTSIIESGLDIPNANTLIVDRADRFGLAQLYQLRGRVGRGASRAYAYFFRHPTVKITDEAYTRLEIFAEHTQLGAGYSIAMRDLELRGAGDILGTRQHGHISAIGFHLYTRLLAEAVRRKKIELNSQFEMPKDLPQAEMPLPVTIDLPLESTIPEDYIPDRQLRLQLYRRMSMLRSEVEIQSLANELEDRFGELPVEVRNLLYQLQIRIKAAKSSLISISTENGQILLQIPENWPREKLPELGKDVRLSKRGLWLSRPEDGNWKDRLVEIIDALNQIQQLG